MGKLKDPIFKPKEIRVLAPSGYKDAYERTAKDPASATVLVDLLGLVGLTVTAEEVAEWSLVRRVQAEVWACATHAKASDNIVRRLPRPDWLPEPWQTGDHCPSEPPTPARTEAEQRVLDAMGRIRVEALHRLRKTNGGTVADAIDAELARRGLLPEKEWSR